tara:strand:- start:338 stop:1438 length:1101 start_codon:yes stop_codon:yes gene_type:complete
MYHFIYPSKDSYIYEVNTNSEKNFGGDGNLVLKKDFDVNSLNGVSRVLLQFDISELSQSIVSNTIPTDAKYFLRLYEQKTSELSPEYSLATFPLSSSWEDGTGYTTQDPNSRNGVSWVRSDESFDNTTWVKNSGPYDSGSRSVSGGGIWVTGSAECSQSFSYESPDVNMDVTDMVNNWLDGTTSNNGLILKWSGSQEDSSDYSGDINFFSSNADSIYSPKIEVRWDSHTTIGDTGLTQLTIDGTKDNYLYMMNLRDTYKETEKPRFRVGARERYQTKSASTTKSTTSPSYVPEGSGSYSIIDVATGATIVPFGDYSLLSSDSGSNYFKQDLRGFINNRSYRIVLRLKTDDNKLKIFDDNFNFKVVS